MKGIKLTLAALAAALLLAGCSSGNTSGEADDTNGSQGESSPRTIDAAEMSSRIEELRAALEGSLPEMVEVSPDKLNIYYGISEDSVEMFSAFVCGSGAMPDEFGIFVTADEEGAKALTEKLNSRIEKQSSTYADYTPGEMYKLEDSFALSDGCTVAYAICADNSAARTILLG